MSLPQNCVTWITELHDLPSHTPNVIRSHVLRCIDSPEPESPANAGVGFAGVEGRPTAHYLSGEGF
jgi:hypothetical protein